MDVLKNTIKNNMPKLYKKIAKIIFNLAKSLLIANDIIKFSKLNDERFPIKIYNIKPMIGDKTKTTEFDLHYVYHPAWAARVLMKVQPNKHIDISSTLHFSSIISAFIPTEFYDYRPANINLVGLKSLKADLNNLPFEDNSIQSLSCMHTIEHIGLGRYGDTIDPNGDIKAINELKRVITKNGHLLFVVPIGRPKIIFNAHRIYTYEMIINYFKNFKLVEFSLISGIENKIIINASKNQSDLEDYGCGCFWFQKI